MKLFSTLAITLLLSTSAFASCYDAYSAKNTEVTKKIDDSNYNRAHVEAALLSSATYTGGMVTVTGATTNPFLFITGHFLLQYASNLTAKQYLDFRIDDDIKKAVELQATLKTSQSLLKEARVGKGPTLQKALAAVNENISTEISMKDLASTIKAQDDQEEYCQAEDKMLSHEGIVALAVNEIKLKQ